MTQPDPSKSIPDSEEARSKAEAAEADAQDEEGDEEPEPEPWTPERVLEWNAYYDLYVMLGVLLLAFITSANTITHSSIWHQLQTGRLITASGMPLTSDPYSYTVGGKTWANVPWLFDVLHALLHKFAYDMTPVDPNEPTVSAARADQVAAGTLVALDALVRLLTAVILLRIGRNGPGLWWRAICVALALGAVLTPAGIILGGIAGPGSVSPGTWGLLFLSLEVWLIHRAIAYGSRGSLYALAPVFLVWANFDDSFLVGLLILAAVAIGRTSPSRLDHAYAPKLGQVLGVLAACALACLANPSIHGAYLAALRPFFGLLRPATDAMTLDQLSYFGKGIRDPNMAGSNWTSLMAHYAIVVAAGYASFWLNRRNFSLGRFAAYTLAALLWGLLIRFGPEFAVVFAVTLALNGQEWYQDQFGSEGRLGAGWTLWSVGGRAVTIVGLFAMVAMAITGYGMTSGESRFGFGYDPSDFAFEAADFLKSANLQGNVFNTESNQGDALIWRAYPDRKVYNDSRPAVYPPEVLNAQRDVRSALSQDDVERWKPLLDQSDVSTVMIQPSNSPNTYRVLSQSPNWIPFYDDGNVVLFGRADAKASDLAFFKENRLDPEAVAYQRSKPTPPVDRPPSPVTWMDKVFQWKSLERPQPHTASAGRWLSPPTLDPASTALPDPARCYLAIREARTALAARPDDTVAYRLLATAYRALMLQETAILAGIPLTPENATAISSLNPRSDVLMTRFRQRITALNYAIQTTPPAVTDAARRDLQALNLELFQLFANVNFIDLGHDRLKAALDGASPTDFTPEGRAQLSQTLAQLDEQVKQAKTRMGELAVEQQYSNLQLGSVALSMGCPGLAIREFEEAERTGTNPALVKPQLLDLYCDTGQPDRAIELLSTGQIGDPVFGAEPGLSQMRQGRAYFLLGNCEYAATLWEKYAIPNARFDRTLRTLGATQALLRGEPKGSIASFLEVPDKLAQQANWAFDAALCRLEGGTPQLASDHFTQTLTLLPNSNLRPLIAYYLERLGKPVPPLKPAEGAAATGTAAKPAEPAEPKAEAAPKPEAPKSEAPKPEAPKAETPKEPAAPEANKEPAKF